MARVQGERGGRGKRGQEGEREEGGGEEHGEVGREGWVGEWGTRNREGESREPRRATSSACSAERIGSPGVSEARSHCCRARMWGAAELSAGKLNRPRQPSRVRANLPSPPAQPALGRPPTAT